jgi:hypothetical protein
MPIRFRIRILTSILMPIHIRILPQVYLCGKIIIFCTFSHSQLTLTMLVNFIICSELITIWIGQNDADPTGFGSTTLLMPTRYGICGILDHNSKTAIESPDVTIHSINRLPNSDNCFVQVPIHMFREDGILLVG